MSLKIQDYDSLEFAAFKSALNKTSLSLDKADTENYLVSIREKINIAQYHLDVLQHLYDEVRNKGWDEIPSPKVTGLTGASSIYGMLTMSVGALDNVAMLIKRTYGLKLNEKKVYIQNIHESLCKKDPNSPVLFLLCQLVEDERYKQLKELRNHAAHHYLMKRFQLTVNDRDEKEIKFYLPSREDPTKIDPKSLEEAVQRLNQLLSCVKEFVAGALKELRAKF